MFSVRFNDKRRATLLSVFRTELGRSIPGTKTNMIEISHLKSVRTLPNEDRRDRQGGHPRVELLKGCESDPSLSGNREGVSSGTVGGHCL